MLILVADDDPDLIDIISYALRKDRHTVITADCGAAALDLSRRHHPDLAILDVMMPEPNGFEVCRQLRQETRMSIILLTARGEESSKVSGLDLGADDYMTKPFGHHELLARVRSLARRSPSGGVPRDRGVLQAGHLWMDQAQHEVHVGKRRIAVTPTEYNVLYCLLLNAGKVVSHDTLFESVFGVDSKAHYDSLRVHIRRLREKIERDPAAPECIVNVRGVGYKVENLTRM